MYAPKPSRGWNPEGTATWQRAEAARRALLAWVREHEQEQRCQLCEGIGVVIEPTAAHPGVRQWLVPVVCRQCRQEDAAR